ncbi:hypothetical protein KDK95_11725 [Actinospica sp. MGRD01-02]|uniref:Uncharacterized protein n=1 Tax=Actinospica acidithermotolerans TaxID=2828514 RepID=A0A941EAZ8_9ACTN|nr:hypothetical protein [Actinospica acidithermotolerans]MBR7826975.1 hypothetical protein [Actinospica acidithermotolerans]
MTAHTFVRRGTGLAAIIAVGSLAGMRRRRENGTIADAGTEPGEQTVVRCCAHHVFTTMWTEQSAHTVGRYGPMRMQRCPVAGHWSLVTPVRGEELTDEQRQAAAAFRDERVG